MASSKRNYQNMDEILDFITNDDDESDDDIILEDEENDMDSDWEYEEEPAVAFIPESHVHETVEQDLNVVESEENETAIVTTPDNPPEQKDISSEEEYRLSEDSTNEAFDAENVRSSSEEEPLINLAKRARVREAPARPRGRVRMRGKCRAVGRVRARGGRGAVGGVRARGRGAAGRARGRARGAVAGQRPRNVAAAQNQRRPMAHRKKLLLIVFPFAEAEGLKVRVDGNTPIDLLNLYLTNEFWDLFVTETNRFTAQYYATRNNIA